MNVVQDQKRRQKRDKASKKPKNMIHAKEQSSLVQLFVNECPSEPPNADPLGYTYLESRLVATRYPSPLLSMNILREYHAEIMPLWSRCSRLVLALLYLQ